MVVTLSRLDAHDDETVVFVIEQHRDEIYGLCAAHGVDATDVRWIEYDVIDMPLLRFGVYLANAEGRRYLACGCGGKFQSRNEDGALIPFHEGACTIAMTTVEHPLAVPLPEWWRPEPTKEARRVPVS